MEEKSETTLYDDYKFLTEEEMERLGLGQFKDDNAVRRHLHGYVIRYDLYKKVICFLDIYMKHKRVLFYDVYSLYINWWLSIHGTAI